MRVQLVRSLIGQAGIIVLVSAGLVLVIASPSAAGRRWAARLAILGLLLSVVGGVVDRGWFP